MLVEVTELYWEESFPNQLGSVGSVMMPVVSMTSALASKLRSATIPDTAPVSWGWPEVMGIWSLVVAPVLNTALVVLVV